MLKSVECSCRKARTYRPALGTSSQFVCKTQLEPAFWLNEFVHNGYRQPHLPTAAYLKSIIEWNNETLNIWSHLLGFIYFTWQLYEVNFNVLPRYPVLPSDHVAMTICIMCAQVCMLLSATYHIFGCASVTLRRRWLRMDVFGISAGLVSIFVSGIYTAFFCFQELRTTYFTMLLGLFMFITYVPSRDDLFDSKVLGNRIGYLHLTYMFISVFGMFPTVHWVSLHGGTSNPYIATWLPNIYILYGLIAFAFVFYASMIPERFVPGTFDVIGCSHQWWHLFIMSAMVYWQRCGVDLLTLQRSMPNFCEITMTPSNITQSFIA